MGLRSGGCSLAIVGSCGGVAVLEAPLDGGGGAVVTGPLEGGGGGGGHTSDPVSDENDLASLASILGARVPVGRPHGPIWIRIVFLYACHGDGKSGTGMTSTGSSSLLVTTTTTTSSSSAKATSTTPSASATPSSPSPIPGDENIGCLYATGYGHGPMPWMAQGISRRPHGELAGSEGSIGQ
jgi:hypothetical protein